jgi:polysaccharide export outer membrane protein
VTPVLAAPAAPVTAPPAIRAGGILDIRVAGEPSLSKDYVVDAAGHINLDMIGQITVEGRTPDQIAAELQNRLKLYLKEPSVTVAELTPLRTDILVTGAALRIGPVQLRSGAGMLEALAAVGGLGPNADGAHATILHRGQPQPETVDVDRLLKGDMSQNLTLKDGDIIRIPAREIASYQVQGEVRQPGSKPLAGTTRVLDALMSSGLTDRADRNRITLVRKDQAQPIVIDLDRALAGETSANVLVEPGDVLTVASRMPVQVMGNVRTATQPLLRNGATLMEAILFAGGFGPDADRSAIEITHKDGTMEKASLADVTSPVGGPVLHAGDLIVVKSTKPEYISLFGAVHNGQIRYENGMKITDVLMSAGLTENSDWKHIRVLRGGDGPDRKILEFNLETYLKSPQAQTMALQPGDRIYVAVHHSGTTVLRRLMDLTPLATMFFYLGLHP